MIRWTISRGIVLSHATVSAFKLSLSYYADITSCHLISIELYPVYIRIIFLLFWSLWIVNIGYYLPLFCYCCGLNYRSGSNFWIALKEDLKFPRYFWIDSQYRWKSNLGLVEFWNVNVSGTKAILTPILDLNNMERLRHEPGDPRSKLKIIKKLRIS